ncbi:MAG TPA: sulfotransferase [Longimicrobiales bacterium]|nr:sulfotransferase [Longimicrobiales bacterium]
MVGGRLPRDGAPCYPKSDRRSKAQPSLPGSAVDPAAHGTPGRAGAPPPRLPDFIVAGALKAGTTSLYRYLAQHPQVFMSPIKEPTYFGAGDLMRWSWFRERQERDREALAAYLAGPMRAPAPLYVTEWEDYVALFRDAGDALAVGEASGGYLILPGAADAIRARLPEARLVFVLRDPADALFSWYLLGLEQDPSPGAQPTFREWLEKIHDPGERGIGPLETGRYATHLGRFFRAFPREQIRVYLYEELRADAGRVLRDVFDFVGVDPGFCPDTSVRHQATAVARWPWLRAVRRRLLGDRPAPRWVPGPVRRGLGRLYRRDRRTLAMDPADRRIAVACYREEILATGELLDRNLSAWLA